MCVLRKSKKIATNYLKTNRENQAQTGLKNDIFTGEVNKYFIENKFWHKGRETRKATAVVIRVNCLTVKARGKTWHCLIANLILENRWIDEKMLKNPERCQAWGQASQNINVGRQKTN